MPVNNVVITRANNGLPRVARSAVEQGQVFSLLTADGSAGKKRFAHLGSNGSHYSLNIDNGAVAVTKNLTRQVALIGSYKFGIDYLPVAQRVQSKRGDMRQFDVFTVKGGTNVYMHIGQRDEDGYFMSINLASGDVASSPKDNSTVTVVGRAKLNVTVAN